MFVDLRGTDEARKLSRHLHRCKVTKRRLRWKTAVAVASCAAPMLLLAGSASAAQRAREAPQKYDFADHGVSCMAKGCLNFKTRSRVVVTKAGDLLYFFSDERNRFLPQGIALKIGRSVNLMEPRRLPVGFRLAHLLNQRRGSIFKDSRYIEHFTVTAGTGTVRKIGNQLQASLVIRFEGIVSEQGFPIGRGVVNWQIDYELEMASRREAMAGGLSTVRGSGTISIIGRAPQSFTVTGSSTLTPI